METLLEQQRRYHEERERTIDSMDKESIFKKGTQREMINWEHRQKILLDVSFTHWWTKMLLMECNVYLLITTAFFRVFKATQIDLWRQRWSEEGGSGPTLWTEWACWVLQPPQDNQRVLKETPQWGMHISILIQISYSSIAFLSFRWLFQCPLSLKNLTGRGKLGCWKQLYSIPYWKQSMTVSLQFFSYRFSRFYWRRRLWQVLGSTRTLHQIHQ